MRKLMKFLPLLLIALVGLTAWSCSDDKDEPIASEQLPAAAKTFIAAYFPSAKIVSSQKDKDEYEVVLSEGTRIDFDKAGEWKDVDAAPGQTIPSGFYPATIDTYISTNMEGSGINEISKEKRGYDVELVNGMDLLFSYEGNFISFD